MQRHRKTLDGADSNFFTETGIPGTKSGVEFNKGRGAGFTMPKGTEKGDVHNFCTSLFFPSTRSLPTFLLNGGEGGSRKQEDSARSLIHQRCYDDIITPTLYFCSTVTPCGVGGGRGEFRPQHRNLWEASEMSFDKYGVQTKPFSESRVHLCTVLGNAEQHQHTASSLSALTSSSKHSPRTRAKDQPLKRADYYG